MTPEEIRTVFAKAREGLSAGRISQEEHDRILEHYYGTTDEQEAIRKNTKRSAPTIIAAIIAVALLVLVPIMWEGEITGRAVYEDPTMQFTATSSIAATGTMLGDGNATIWFDTENASLLVGTVSSDTGAPMTDKAGYSPGEQITILNAPNASYYFDDGTAAVATEMPFNATVDGTVLIVTADSTHRLPIIIGEAQRKTIFNGLCVETCAMEAADGTLRIETQGTIVNITSIEASTPNRPPETTGMPPMTVNGTTTLELDAHFTDPDGDELFFTTSTSGIATLAVTGSTLTITPVTEGTESIIIYASDLQELVPVTVQLTTVLAPDSREPVPETNGTPNTSAPTPEDIQANITNTTGNITAPNETQAPTNGTANVTLDCSAPNPNDRPVECLLTIPEYNLDEDIYWEDTDRQQVARFTIVGNLLIKGDIIERSTGNPGPRDFRIGYTDDNYVFRDIVWIDGQGNLHMRGTLHEENGNLDPPAGTYTVTTKRRIYLAHVDFATGDLYVRGNVIPYRRSFG